MFKMDEKLIPTLTKTAKTCKNHPSAYKYEAAVTKKITEQLDNGAMFCDDNWQGEYRTPIKIVIQKDKPRMVKNYSNPYEGVSVNDIIPDEAVTVELPSFKDTCTFAYGENNNITHMGKVDLKAAFEQVFLNHTQQVYAAYEWQGHTYVENSMPPGTRAAVQAMQDFGTALRVVADECLPQSMRGNSMGYVDDHIFRGRSRMECVFYTVHFIGILTNLKVIVNADKTIFGEPQIIVLGNDFNLRECIKDVRISWERAQSYMKELWLVYQSEFQPRYEMDSILGKMFSTQHITWPLKCLTRPIIDILPKNYNGKDYNKTEKIQITEEVRRSIELWFAYFDMRNSICIVDVIQPPIIEENMKSDGSDIGGGACTGTHYTSWLWEKQEVNPNGKKNTPELELKAIEGGLTAFEPYLAGKTILLEVDSQTARDALIKKDSPNKAMWKVIKRICIWAIRTRSRWYVKWIPRELNSDSDALSKNDIARFKRIMDEQNRPYDAGMMLFERHPDNFKIDLTDYMDDIPYGESLGKKYE